MQSVAGRRRERLYRWCVTLSLVVWCCSCELGYYAHLAGGQAALILDCHPLSALGTDSLSGADPERSRQVRLVKAIRTFAAREGLDTVSSYDCLYDTGGQPVGWNVSACPPDRFEPYHWSFPVVGSLPYKGFFDRDRAEAERQDLEAAGFDVLLRPLTAYSTLGYFSDPLLSPMLEYSPDQLAELLLHELTHTTLFISGHAEFNESLATFVGRTASEQFLREQFGEDTPLIAQAQAKRADRSRFRAFMNGIVSELDSLYALDLPRPEVLRQREILFTRAQHRYRLLRDSFVVIRFDGFLEWQVNNARLMSYQRYNRDLGDFEAAYAGAGRRLDRLFELLRTCTQSDPWLCLRSMGTEKR